MGHSEMIESLIVENKRLVYFVVNQYKHRADALHVTKDELVSEGLYALYRAAQKYDPDKGASFATFASMYMHGFIKNYFRDHGRLIRIPRQMQEGGRPEDYEIKMVFFGNPTAGDSENGKAAKDAEAYISQCSDFSEIVVQDFVQRLPERYREILRLRMEHGMSQRAIGSALGIGQMTVSRRLMTIQQLYQKYASA